MVNCPHCDEEMSYFSYSVPTTENGSYNGNGDYDVDDNTGGGEDLKYKCPDCDEVLFESEQEADRFLRGEPTTPIPTNNETTEEEKEVYIEI